MTIQPFAQTNTLGPVYLLKGFALLTHREVRPFVVFPLLLNLMLFIGLAFYAVDSFSAMMDKILAYIPAWLEFLSWIIWLLFGALLLIIYGYSFALVGNLLASPFYGLLAERVAALSSGVEQSEPFSWRALAAIAGRSIRRELLKLGYFLPRIIGVLLLTLLLSLIPLLNLLAPLLAFLWGSWSLALQYLDYPADNNGDAFPELRQQARRQRFSSLGFGGAVLLATSIPLLNMLTIPASVIGATLLWQAQLRNQ